MKMGPVLFCFCLHFGRPKQNTVTIEGDDGDSDSTDEGDSEDSETQRFVEQMIVREGHIFHPDYKEETNMYYSSDGSVSTCSVEQPHPPTVNTLARSEQTLSHLEFKTQQFIKIFSGLQSFCDEREEQEIWDQIQSDSYKPFELIIGFLQSRVWALTSVKESEWPIWDERWENVQVFRICKSENTILVSKDPRPIILLCDYVQQDCTWLKWREVTKLCGCLVFGKKCGSHCLFREVSNKLSFEKISSWEKETEQDTNSEGELVFLTDQFWEWVEQGESGLLHVKKLHFHLVAYINMPTPNPACMVHLAKCDTLNQEILVVTNTTRHNIIGKLNLKWKTVVEKFPCLFGNKKVCCEDCKYKHICGLNNSRVSELSLNLCVTNANADSVGCEPIGSEHTKAPPKSTVGKEQQ